jgi:thioredoxin-dependent peroxiredoxin
MPLKLQVIAPDFSLPSSSGQTFTLRADMQGKPCIVYFYPKDFTSVCTAEACEFRDHFADFREYDIDIVGISRDSVATHQKFIQQHRLPFQLLADEQGKVSRLYDAVVPIIGMTKRITYLLDAQHHIAGVYEAMFESAGHIRAMIAKVKAKP